MTILVATDYSKGSAPAVLTAAMLSHTFKTPLRLLHVVDFAGDDNAWRVLYETPDEIEAHARTQAHSDLVSFYEETIPENEQADYTTVVRFGTPGDGILAEAKHDPPVCIVAGTVGESRLQHVFFGRTSGHLVRDTDLPVLAVPPDALVKPYGRILVAVDFSDCSQHALETAGKFAPAFGATVEVVHAVDIDLAASSVSLSALVGDVGPKVDELLESRTEQLKTWVSELNLPYEVQEFHMIGSRADTAIVEKSNSGNFDLIVMGTHGRRGFARWFLGSTAERVLRRAKTPVLVVSAPTAD